MSADPAAPIVSQAVQPGRVATTATTAVNVRHYRADDCGAWNSLVLASPDGTFFHRAEWRDVLEGSFRHRSRYLVAERGGTLTGVLPLVEMRSRLFGHSLVSTPFCVYGGIVATDEGSREALTLAAADVARRLKVDHLEMRNRARRHPEWVVKDLYVTFRRPISPDSEQNLQAIPRKQRAVVRKGIKEGLAAEIDKDAKRHYQLYSESLRNLGTPVFARRYLERLLAAFGDDCEILTVTHESGPVASCLSFFFRDEVLPYYGGGSTAARALGANDFMYWQIMERARQRGCRVFDFGRSKRGTGAYDFKRYWGFEPEPLHYEYLLVNAREMPNLNPTNPKYERVIRTWRRLPLAATQVLGPPLARHLG